MKTLILLPYFNRPKLLLNALNSLKQSTNQDWLLAFIDDASPTPEGRQHVHEVLGYAVVQDRVFFYAVSKEMKEQCMWTTQPIHMNIAMRQIDSDLTVILCDDDALLPDYIENCVQWFSTNPQELYGFSNVRLFFPDAGETPNESLPIRAFHTNRLVATNPVNAIDASQIVWRSKIALERGCFFDEARQYDHDASMWEVMWAKGYGLCPFMGFYGQYKGIHQYQLGKMKGVTNFEAPRE